MSATNNEIERAFSFFQIGISAYDYNELRRLNKRLAKINLDYANDNNWNDEKEKKRTRVANKISVILAKYPYMTEISYSPYYSCIKIYRDDKDEIGLRVL